MKINNYLANTLMVLISILLTVALALSAIEIYLRSQFGIGETHNLQDMVVFHEERGWELKPGNYRHFDPGAMTLSSITINSLGMRGKAVQPKASPERERVTLVGDSFMFAMALDEGGTVADRVQTALGGHYEIVNLGVPGYGTGQEILFLQDLRNKGYDRGSRVILVFFTNDIQDNLGLDYGTLTRQTHKPAFSVGSDGRLVVEKPIKPIGPKNSIEPERNRYLFDDFLKNRTELIAARFPFLVKMLGVVTGGISLPRDPGIITGWYTEGWEARWQVTSRLIEYMANTVRTQAGSEFDIVFIPSPFQVEPVFKEIVASNALHNPTFKMFLEDIDRPQRMLMELCEKRKIRCVDATDKLRAASRKQPTYFLHEGHLNAYGVSVIYDVFEELVRH
jgi:hypothetical protein